MDRKNWKGVCAIWALGVLPVYACSDDSSNGDASSDEGETTESTDTTESSDATDTTESTDATDADGGGMCGGSSTTADCASYCAGVIAAACPGGPATQQECEQGCEMLNGAVDQCPAWGALAECAQTAPTFTCFMGETVPEGCEDEFYCVSLCFG